MAVRGPRPVIILGPTAGGKSELAAQLAVRLGGQVIGADSMQVYRHMDAGTAKPDARLRQLVEHHLIDIVEPTQRFTVASWLELADQLIEKFVHQSIRPIIVGGTNLYIKALLEGLFDGPPQDVALRAQLAALPGPKLHHHLAQVDPAAAQRIHPNDQKKLIRALEVHQLTGRPISDWQRQWRDVPQRYRHDPILIGLEWPVEAINHRINQRVKEMFFPIATMDRPVIDSLPDEVARLETAGLLGPQARQALGYKQVLEARQGRYPMDEAFEKTKILTRRFAKNQRTWLRRFLGVKWIVAHDLSSESLVITAMESIHDQDTKF